VSDIVVGKSAIIPEKIIVFPVRVFTKICTLSLSDASHRYCSQTQYNEFQNENGPSHEGLHQDLHIIIE